MLVTAGDPARLTGGHLYHRRVAEAAADLGVCIAVEALPERSLGPAIIAGAYTLARVRAMQPDALLVDSIATAALALPLLAAQPPVPVIGMLHQPPGGVRPGGGLARGPRARLDRLFLLRADRLIVPSETLARALRQAGIDPARLRVVPPGHDLPAPTGPLPDLRRDGRLALLCVANWLPAKGIDVLLEAVAGLPAGAGARLHLVGDTAADPAYTRRLRARLAAPDLRGRVVVHGPLPPAAVAAYYRAADLFVLPSRAESYGMAFAEAMAAGLPVVAARAGHVPCLVADGETGLLVPPDDPVALRTALQRLIADPPRRQALGAAARRRAAALPTWRQTAAAVVAVVREAIAGGN